MSKLVGFLYRYEWFNQYTTPPDGKPRIIAEIFIVSRSGEGARIPEEIKRFMKIGDGYFISITGICEPIRPWSRERLINYRRKILERRIKKKYPLMAEQFIDQEIKKNKKYYIDGIGNFDDERVEIIKNEAERFKCYMENAGRLIVYGESNERVS